MEAASDGYSILISGEHCGLLIIIADVLNDKNVSAILIHLTTHPVLLRIIYFIIWTTAACMFVCGGLIYADISREN